MRDPQADPRQIASDWVRMTFSTKSQVVTPVVDMMMVWLVPTWVQLEPLLD